MINRVVLVGRLVRDPELRTTTTGKSVADFTIAVDKRVKPVDGPTADFFRVSCWGNTAEFVNNYLSKGRLVALDGRLQSRKYTDNQGNNREAVEIVAEIVQGLDRPKDESGAPPQSVPNEDGGDYDPFADA